MWDIKQQPLPHPLVGGGFGGKGLSQQAVEAARLAKIAGKPVQVMWNRQESFFFDNFRPAAVVKINSGIQNTGKIVFWDYRVDYAGDRSAAHFYDIPNHRTISAGISHMGGWSMPPGSHLFGVGAWRAPAANTNAFARESQIDKMAASPGIDPLEFRLKKLKDQRILRILKGREILDLNFDTYEIPQFSWLPRIETVLIENKNLPPQGGGEPAIVCMVALIDNAIYYAVGSRLFQLPMTLKRIKAALV